MVADPRLRSIAAFEGLEDEDLERICRGVEQVELDAGETLFREGDPGDVAYVVIDGEFEVLKAGAQRSVRIAVRGAGEVVGEIALLYAEPRSATVRARVASSCLAIPKSALDDLLATSPVAARRMLTTLGARLRETHQEVQQSQRMAQLGTLAIGVAHELNNPAAGVQRAAGQLRDELGRLSRALGGDRSPANELAAALGRRAALPLLVELQARRVATASLSALQRADREDEFAGWLQDHDIVPSAELTAGLVDAGATTPDLAQVASALEAASVAAVDRGAALAAGLGFLASVARLQLLADAVVEGASRISGIAAALKRHDVTDQAPVVSLDVVRGVEDTLLLLGHKVRRVEVVRRYDDDVPHVEGYGRDLNQVWTNLIDNACDALLDGATPNPTLTVEVGFVPTGDDGPELVVGVADNGPGIPDDQRERIFDAFWTTKAPGHGTGLGLQISARIVAEHDGRIVVTSVPGATRFEVHLPVTLRADPDDRG